jgi:hypothetical protein
MTKPITAMAAHKIIASAIIFGCVLFWHVRCRFEI